jgi:hypothetical protein
LTTGGGGRVAEAAPRANPLPRVAIAPLSSETPPARLEDVAGPSLSDLRAAVDALKRPRRSEYVSEPDAELAEPLNPADSAEPEPAPAADESTDAARR